MIGSTSASFLFSTLSKDAAQPSTRVGIDGPKDIRFTVFKVLKPSSQGPAQILTNRTQDPQALVGRLRLEQNSFRSACSSTSNPSAIAAPEASTGLSMTMVI